MRRDWRLDMQAPFALQSARQNGDQLLVTEGADGRAGVELRQPQLNLTTVARKESGGGAMPATGWDGRFDRVAGTLQPAARPSAASRRIGADAAPDSWWERWGLWNVFGVLLVVGFVYWAAGLVPAAIAALALLLTYQEAPEYIWLWGNLLAALAIARAAPEGSFQQIRARLSHGEFRGARHSRCCRSCGCRCATRCIRSSSASDATLRIMTRNAASARCARAWIMPQPAMRRRRPPTTAPHANANAAAAPAADADGSAGEDIAQCARREPVGERLGERRIVVKLASTPRRWCSATPRAPCCRPAPAFPPGDTTPTATTGAARSNPRHGALHLRRARWCCSSGACSASSALARCSLWLALLSYGKTLPTARHAAHGRRRARCRCCWHRAAARHCGMAVGARRRAAAAGARAPSCSASSRRGSPPRPPARRTAPRSPRRAWRSRATGSRWSCRSARSPNVAVAMPHASDRWQLDEVSVDARGALAIARERRRVAVGAAHRRARTPCVSRAGSRPPNPCSSPSRSRRASST